MKGVFKMNNLIKSIFKTAVYFLDQTDRMAGDLRDRVSDTVDGAADRLSDVRNQAQDLYQGQDHTLRNVLVFAAGVGVGVGTALLLAPASGEEIRNSIGERVQTIGDKVRGRVKTATGTEGY
jgi:gas vesicle protein